MEVILIDIQAINDRLQALLGEVREDSLREAMAYSVSAGGKRLRPMLLLAACEAVKGEITPEALDFACAVEMIHTYSLIHDDLPAMDNDDFRRGQPTNHKKFGEAMAILAGDGLLSRAFEVMSRVCCELPRKRNIQAMLAIARAAGDNGMVAGQVADMNWENKKADADTLISIHTRKTGALFQACFSAGALLGGASIAYSRALTEAGGRLGYAFQILDDILDVTATDDILGKPVRSDDKNGKNTYVTVHGLDKAMADYRQVADEALALLAALPQKTTTLRDLTTQIIRRVN